MWPSQWFTRIYVTESVVHEDLWCRVFSGSRGSVWSFQYMRIYVSESVVHGDLSARVSD